MTLTELKNKVGMIRTNCLAVEQQVRQLKEEIAKQTGTPVDDAPPGSDKGEAIANAMLAVRHLEDARMRLGKLIQAADGGTSVYDK
jgi:hypothetical protein